jgi:outer membrane protein TolC
MARARRLPHIGVQAAYEWNGRHPFGSDGSNWTVGAGVTIPIFDGTEHGAREARARADRDRALALKDALIDGTRLEIEAAEAALVGSAERLLTAEAAVKTAAEALRIVRERYEEGLTVITELLGAEAALTQARGTREQATHDLAVAQAEERFALGLPLVEPSPRDEE